jgi:hypothetical protein
MRARRAERRVVAVVAALCAGCASSAATGAAGARASGTPTATAAGGAPASPAPAAASAAARWEVSEAAGHYSLIALMESMAAALGGAGSEGGAGLDVAFLVDASSLDAHRPLSLSHLALRALTDGGARVAAVSFAGAYGGTGASVTARREIDFSTDALSVRHALARVPFGTATAPPPAAAVTAALREAARLSWRPGAPRALVVLAAGGLEPTSAGEAAAATGAGALRWVRLRLELGDGYGTGSDRPEDADKGVDLRAVAGLFREGTYHEVLFAAAPPLAAAAGRLRARADATTGGRAELVLVVDSTGVMGGCLAVLRKEARRALRAFLDRAAGRRVALVRYGTKIAPRVELAFTADLAAAVAAVDRLKRGPVGDWPKELFPALARARTLAWAPGAARAAVVLTGAPAGGVDEALLDWAETESLQVDVIEQSPIPEGPAL